MNKFKAQLYVYIGALLEQLARSDGPANLIRICKEMLPRLAAELQNIGCRQSSKAVARYLADVSRRQSVNERRSRSSELRQLIFGEMEDHLFFWIPANRSGFYSQPEPLFGETVALRFPSTLFDIEEAGKCFATGRYTASVLHQMRVLEIGLACLSRALKVPYGEGSWQGLLNRLESKWKKIEQRQRKPRAWRKDRQFFAEAFVEFRYLKDAWRNYAMHAHATYDEKRAEAILLHVNSFMNHLATRLKE